MFTTLSAVCLPVLLYRVCLPGQDVIRELKSGSEVKSVDATPTIEFDFKAKFAETKAAAKVCDSLK